MRVIPELVVRDVSAARSMLCDVFGFAPDGPLLRAASQTIALRQGGADHGVIDHLALSVPDVAVAAAQMIARGAVVDATVTPDGPLEIAEFWGGGVRYQFLQGPEGARIELCCTLVAPKPFGHDHIGIPVADITASTEFALSLGGRLLSAVTLHRVEGDTEVRFIALGDAVLEFYAPPAPFDPPPSRGKWNRLFVSGLVAEVTGPGGLTLSPLPDPFPA